MNIFAVAIDSLDKEDGMSEITRMVADVGRSHQKKRLTKKAYNVIINLFIE
jgi:hypothetical protein